MEVYLTQKRDLEVKVSGIKAVIDKTDEQMERTRTDMEVLQGTLESIEFTKTTAPCQIYKTMDDFMT